jgi:hypothetical protein
VFNEEEEKLTQWKEAIEEIEIPEARLEEAIMKGFERGKNVHSNKKFPYLKRGIWSVVVAAILLITLVTSIRVSPAFANAVASIPGMEKIVAIIQDNKGLQAAISNEYYQDINVTSEKDGIAVTLEGVIADDSGMVLFYSMKKSSKNTNTYIENIEFFDQKGNPIEWRSIGINYPGGQGNDSMTSTVEINYKEPLTTDKLMLQFNMMEDGKVEAIDLPFTLEKRVVESKVYTLNETVEIEGQNITVKSITIEPIRVAVHVEMDPKNTKKIFEFKDLRLVDEKGEAWTSIQNGTTAQILSEDEKIIYLQSNYFEEPKGLSLQFNKLMALDKEESYVIVDTEKSEIIKQPSDNLYSKIDVGPDYIIFFYKGDEGYHPFSTFIDKNEKEFQSNGSWTSGTSGEMKLGVQLPEEPFENPLKIPLNFHPRWIEGNVKINVR